MDSTHCQLALPMRTAGACCTHRIFAEDGQLQQVNKISFSGSAGVIHQLLAYSGVGRPQTLPGSPKTRLVVHAF